MIYSINLFNQHINVLLQEIQPHVNIHTKNAIQFNMLPTYLLNQINNQILNVILLIISNLYFILLLKIFSIWRQQILFSIRQTK